MDSKHILMIPMPGFGHLIPLLELAKKLTAHHRVTFAVSEHLHDDIKCQNLLEKDHENIELVAIDHGGFIPDPTDRTTGAKNIDHLMATFNIALEEFLLSIYSFQEKSFSVSGFGKVHVVIVDNFLSRQIALCYQKDILVYHFNTASAEGLLLKGLLFDLTSPTYDDPNESFPLWWSPEKSCQPLPPDEFHIMRGIKITTSLVEGVIVNSTRELEGPALEKIQKIEGMREKPIFVVGPLIPTKKSTFVVEWLNEKEVNSVVYIAFGTIASPKPEQVREMARAFIKMDRPFIWSLSETHFQYLPEDMRDEQSVMQSAFLEARFLILHWVPQKAILAHPATAVFLSHCGWNSTLEALSNGVPVIAWPMFADQGLNAELLARNGVGVVVEGTGMQAKRLIPAEEIVDIIHSVIASRYIHENARRWKCVFDSAVCEDGSSERDLAALKKAL